MQARALRLPAEAALVPNPLIEIVLHVFRSATGCNDVQFPVAIEVRQAKVFTGHGIVVYQRLLPMCPFRVDREKKFDPDSNTRFAHRTPAYYDLIAPRPGQIPASQSVPVHERGIEQMALPEFFPIP